MADNQTPDKLIDAEKVEVEKFAQVQIEAEMVDWIVRLERRDVECQFRFVDKHGNINSRLSSAMRLTKEVAKQFAKAITEQHPKYKARAMLYATMQKRKQQETEGIHHDRNW